MSASLSAILSALDKQQPIHLNSLLQILDNTATFVWYSDIIHQYLPEFAAEILGMADPALSVNRFAERFSQHVFPLNQNYISMMSDSIDNWEDDDDDFDEKPQTMLSIIADAIPVELYGFDQSYPHDLWDDQPLGICLTVLLASTEAIWISDIPGLRPSWFDMATHHVPPHILARIPPEGYSRDHILLAADQCQDADTAVALRWLLSDTGNPLLDDCFDQEAYPFYGDTWDPETVEQCRSLWTHAEPVLAQIKEFMRRMTVDPHTEMAALIDLMESTPIPQSEHPPDSSPPQEHDEHAQPGNPHRLPDAQAPPA